MFDKDAVCLSNQIARCKQLHKLALLKGDWKLAKEQEQRVAELSQKMYEDQGVQVQVAPSTEVAVMEEDVVIQQGQMPVEEPVEIIDLSVETMDMSEPSMLDKYITFAKENKLVVGAGLLAAYFLLFRRKKVVKVLANPFKKKRKARRKGTRKGMVRKTARRAYKRNGTRKGAVRKTARRAYKRNRK
tara:strand:- start:107 stop:667 length:561 start_codon:yes stop_codon:yes gene_type:complete